MNIFSDIIKKPPNCQCYFPGIPSLRVPHLLFEAITIENSVERGAFDDKAAARFLHDAQIEETKLGSWSPQPNEQLIHSIPLLQASAFAIPARYPQRIDVYQSTTTASLNNRIRLIRIKLLTSIAKVAKIAQHQPSMQPEIAHLLLTQLDAETSIKSLVDDICATVPYFLRPQSPESLLPFFPHEPRQARFDLEITLQMIPTLSQMIPTLQMVCEEECTPTSAKEWLWQYASLLEPRRTHSPGASPQNLSP